MTLCATTEIDNVLVHAETELDFRNLANERSFHANKSLSETCLHMKSWIGMDCDWIGLEWNGVGGKERGENIPPLPKERLHSPLLKVE